MKTSLKGMLCILLELCMLFPVSVSSEIDARVQCYNTLKIIAQMLIANEPEYEVADQSYEGTLALVIVEGKKGQPGFLQAIGPNAKGETCVAAWTLSQKPEQGSTIIKQVMNLWDALTFGLEDGEFQLMYMSDRLSNGIVIIRYLEEVEKIVSEVIEQVYAQSAAEKESSPLLPSIDSFSGYRLRVDERFKKDQNRTNYSGFANDEVNKAFVDDYVKLLIENCSFELIKHENAVYYLDHTGNGAMRPVYYKNLPADVIVISFLDGMGGEAIIYYSDGLSYVETDDRTTVNIHNK